MQKITPCLWFDGQAEEAANFYVSLFENSKILDKTYYSEAGPGPAGSVLTVTFELDGQEYVALNGGPEFKFTEAVSFTVNCKDQAEVDAFWDKLTKDGGEEVQCGWLRDKFGLSWQIVPAEFQEMLKTADAGTSARMMQAMFKMKKLDLATLKAAAAKKESAAV